MWWLGTVAAKMDANLPVMVKTTQNLATFHPVVLRLPHIRADSTATNDRLQQQYCSRNESVSGTYIQKPTRGKGRGLIAKAVSLNCLVLLCCMNGSGGVQRRSHWVLRALFVVVKYTKYIKFKPFNGSLLPSILHGIYLSWSPQTLGSETSSCWHLNIEGNKIRVSFT